MQRVDTFAQERWQLRAIFHNFRVGVKVGVRQPGMGSGDTTRNGMVNCAKSSSPLAGTSLIFSASPSGLTNTSRN